MSYNTIVTKEFTDGRTELSLNIILDKDQANKIIEEIKRIITTPTQPEIVSHKITPLVSFPTQTSHKINPLVPFATQTPAPTSPKRSYHKCDNCKSKKIQDLKDECNRLGIDIKGVSNKEILCSKLSNHGAPTKVASPSTFTQLKPPMRSPTTFPSLQKSMLPQTTVHSFPPLQKQMMPPTTVHSFPPLQKQMMPPINSNFPPSTKNLPTIPSSFLTKTESEEEEDTSSSEDLSDDE